MKRVLLLLAVIAFGASVNAQNVQLHYDLGEGRNYLTTTVEMFKPDKLGNTFFFVDFDYGIPGHENMSNAYFEIARVMTLGKSSPFGWHAEYNGGFGKVPNFDSYYSVENAWLTGVDYSWNAEDFSKGISLKVMYKKIQKKQNSVQFTGVWYVNFAKDKLTFTGFADFWKEDSDFNFDGTADASWVFLAEPQLWYNACSHFSVGTEIELSNNFVGAGSGGFKIMPTIGAKYTF